MDKILRLSFMIMSWYLIIIMIFSNVYASNTKQLLQTLRIECNKHKEANDVFYRYKLKDRCYWIGASQLMFETRWCIVWAWAKYNNCYWFKRKQFIRFKTKNDSIKFYVQRFYKYDKYKTIRQIISWWCYVSPADNRYKCFPWFTANKEHQYNYYNYVKKFFSKQNYSKVD